MKSMKRLLSMVLALTLLLGLLPALGGGITAEAFTPEHDIIRIGINAHSCWPLTPNVVLTNSGGLRVGSFNAQRQFVPAADAATHTTLRVTSSGGTVQVADGAGNVIHTGQTVNIGPVNEAITTNYRLPGTSFGDGRRDNFDFFGGFRITGSGSNLIVVNYVDIEDYLKGVVPYEAIPSWPLQVLKAQAVAARTYAVRNFGRLGAHGFDLTNTTATQVYRGMHYANENTNLSVTGTRGQVILYNGQPIEAVYHSAAGGATEDVENVWESPLPYLRGRPNPHEETPAHIPWTRTLTAAEFLTHMRSRDSGFNLPDIVDVQTQLTANGNMFSVTFVASNGATRTYERQRARTTVLTGLHPVINSQRFTITRNPAAASLAAGPDTATAIQTLGHIANDYAYDLLDIYPTHSELELFAMQDAGLVSFDIPPSEEAEIAALSGGITFTIQNFGFGHNVGMSQHGAASMARLGHTYYEILHFYYTGITISGLDTTGSGFVDVPRGRWYFDAVQYVREHGLMQGTGDNRFSPQLTTTRGMFVTILGRMAGIDTLTYAPQGMVAGNSVNFRTGPGMDHALIRSLPQGTQMQIIGQHRDWLRVLHDGTEGFVLGSLVTIMDWNWADTAPGAFYAPYVAWATSTGVSSGTGPTTFDPGRAVTRQEMAALLYGYIESMDITLTRDTSIPMFADFDTVADWAREGVISLQRAGIVQGVGYGNFAPLWSSNRASVATMMMNFHRQHQ
ncbi:MAG: SpoIID/LytB domain-containing protein [Oscillospiraceae bacterium]|nr:SpoIID/LytB domain-containing protein [Oscillospiraceae bacterium]